MQGIVLIGTKKFGTNGAMELVDQSSHKKSNHLSNQPRGEKRNILIETIIASCCVTIMEMNGLFASI